MKSLIVIGAFDFKNRESINEVNTYNNPLQASHYELLQVRDELHFDRIICYDPMYPRSATQDGIVYRREGIPDLKTVQASVNDELTIVSYSACATPDAVVRCLWIERWFSDKTVGANLSEMMNFGPNVGLKLADMRSYKDRLDKSRREWRPELMGAIEASLPGLRNMYWPNESEQRENMRQFLEDCALDETDALSGYCCMLLCSMVSGRDSWNSSDNVEARKAVSDDLLGRE